MKETLSSTRQSAKVLMSVFMLTFGSLLYGSSDSEYITTIILINRQAELVDVNQDGEVLKRHMAIPDYFSSGRSHKKSLRSSLQKMKDYGAINHTLPGSSNLCSNILQSYILSVSQSKPLLCNWSSKHNNDFLNNLQDDVKSNKSSWNDNVSSIFKIKQEKEFLIYREFDQKRSFADVFYPQVIAVTSIYKQHNIESKRFYSGVLTDT